MFVRDPILELQLFRMRQQELQNEAARERLVRSLPRRREGFGRRLVLGIGNFLVTLGEKLRTELDEPTEGAAA